MDDIYAISKYNSNAELILDVHKLGLILETDRVLDATYGNGVWWKRFRPAGLITNDLYEGYPDMRFDFRAPPFPDETFDVVCYDPPFKLNGTPTARVDRPYGVGQPRTRDERLRLIVEGLEGLAPIVKRGGRLMVKGQNQVNGGNVRWQMIDIANRGMGLGFKVEEILFPQFGYRPQPGERQVHARQNYSFLIVLKKPLRVPKKPILPV